MCLISGHKGSGDNVLRIPGPNRRRLGPVPELAKLSRMSAARPLGGYAYQRHQPEQSVLYKVIQANLETFLSQVHEECGRPLPGFVEKEFREYLSCGILAHGFLRARCESCSHEHLVAFSCKRRGFCPSCGGRRMSESAIHLVEEVLPIKPIRQWVISFPVQIRLLLAVRPKVMSAVLKIVTSSISGYLSKRAGFKRSKSKTGVVTLIQRFGGSINPILTTQFKLI